MRRRVSRGVRGGLLALFTCVPSLGDGLRLSPLPWDAVSALIPSLTDRFTHNCGGLSPADAPRLPPLPPFLSPPPCTSLRPSPDTRNGHFCTALLHRRGRCHSHSRHRHVAGSGTTRGGGGVTRWCPRTVAARARAPDVGDGADGGAASGGDGGVNGGVDGVAGGGAGSSVYRWCPGSGPGGRRARVTAVVSDMHGSGDG